MCKARPLAIDIFCGLGGWTEGLLAEGFRVVGIDNERHVYGDAKYPAQLVLQDVRTVHGAQLKDAALIVASPPCTEFSYMAMPWTRAKQIARALRGQDEFPEGYTGSRTRAQLTELFDACFRIQREACSAAGHHIPLVVENVRGAIPWIGRSRWHYGSYHLWGDVPALMPVTRARTKAPKAGTGRQFCAIRIDQIRDVENDAVKVPTMGQGWYPPDHPKHVAGSAFNGHAERNLRATKNHGGSWFNVAHNTTSGHGQNPVTGIKTQGRSLSRGAPNKFGTHNMGSAQQIAQELGIKQHGSGREWFAGDGKISRMTSSRSSARKHASAQIAKIPLPLARHIARAWWPGGEITDADA